jgi:hypothetical protein
MLTMRQRASISESLKSFIVGDRKKGEVGMDHRVIRLIDPDHADDVLSV